LNAKFKLDKMVHEMNQIKAAFCGALTSKATLRHLKRYINPGRPTGYRPK